MHPRPPTGVLAGRNTEAVFSSTEDRNRASYAKAVVAGPPIAFTTDQSRWRPLRSFAGQVAESLFAVLFPSDCRICDAPLTSISRLPVCRQCLDAIEPISDDICALCGERLFSPYAVGAAQDERRCGLCRRIEPAFERAVAYGSYESGLRELIHILKYGGVRPAANVLGRRLGEAIASLEQDFFGEPIIVIPVPLSRTRSRQRGFNQAELIARAAIKVSGRESRFHLRTDVLTKKRDTISQIGLTNHQRRQNLRGAFGIMQTDAVKGREILVVDDVYTTGATVSECARVLLRGGATRVWVATVARTLKISAQQLGAS